MRISCVPYHLASTSIHTRCGFSGAPVVRDLKLFHVPWSKLSFAHLRFSPPILHTALDLFSVRVPGGALDHSPRQRPRRRWAAFTSSPCGPRAGHRSCSSCSAHGDGAFRFFMAANDVRQPWNHRHECACAPVNDLNAPFSRAKRLTFAGCAQVVKRWRRGVVKVDSIFVGARAVFCVPLRRRPGGGLSAEVRAPPAISSPPIFFPPSFRASRSPLDAQRIELARSVRAGMHVPVRAACILDL